ncbi:hypothetical protein C9J01_18920 [Photobacterium rosenbergii]|uniref:Uncharacterized protein n=1 Tax=Photobacterium rosenbergii TaxID=294936 RepID=A0A2T3N9V7_9GAMM|nr:hypothetical protein [Photobacterium rosenbergii]PSW10285.1 hypothetical protein C9J01_18920 [Photobacterium rosenbergii]
MRVSIDVKKFGVEATMTDHLGETVGKASAFAYSDLLSATFDVLDSLGDVADLANVKAIHFNGEHGRDIQMDGVLDIHVARKLEMPCVPVLIGA